MRHLLFTFCWIAVTGALQAQIVKIDSTTNWRKVFRTGLNINQASFSSNWKAGGINSVGFNTLLNYKANYKSEKRSWDNEIDFVYGMIDNAGQGPRKTLDRLYLDTKFGHNLSEKWSLFASANFLSQFAPGFTYANDPNTGQEVATRISDFLAPAFVTTALGFAYQPVKHFKTRISPVAPRLTIVHDVDRFVTPANPTPFGVEPGRSTRFEWFAFQLLSEFDKDVAPNLNLKWRYLLFANYETFEAKKIDHRLDVTLSAKVAKYFNVSLSAIGLYDFDQDDQVQLTQAFSLGFLYTFQNFKP